MPFIGNKPADSFTSFAKQDFTTSATTSYTLDNPVANENEIALFINFVRQEPTTAYTASGTSLTLTSATSASDDMYCVFLGKALQTVNPPAGSVGLSQLSATGTKDSTTFLRGDNTFASAGGSMTPAFSAYLSSNQNISGAFTPTKVQFDTEIFDTDSCYDNSTNYRFTPTTAGKYFISTNASFQTSSGNWTKPFLQIYKNGTGEAFARLAIDSITALTGGADHTAIMVSAIFDANGSSDYFEVYFAGSSANCQLQGTASNKTSFNAYKIIE